MSCCNCCENIFEIGCVKHCYLQFKAGVSVPVGLGGVWALYVEYGRKTFTFLNDLSEGQQINFDVGILTAYYKYKAYIEKPDGTKARFNIDSDIFDCFTFETKLNIQKDIELNSSSVS